MQQPETNPSFQAAINPYSGKAHVCDTVEVYEFQEAQFNNFLSIGYVPYAANMVPDPRPEIQERLSKALLTPGGKPGMAFTTKYFLRRERAVEGPIPTLSPVEAL